MRHDVQQFQYERTDFQSSELVENTKGEDFSDQNLGEIRGQHGGHKKSVILGSCGVKNEVGSKDEISSGNMRTSDQGQSISLTF